ncbi:hypothetical protein CMUS01_15610 [Colletotrichum musicola]|uniref:Uncharacterized protein n=1 Tax=Colletotrichum musicola TaxID=2175873 RepID=A0A8H6IVW4_9PEZI|nr:hypothetical protein CMUS01_15610 [Colletotrichum musicola]
MRPNSITQINLKPWILRSVDIHLNASPPLASPQDNIRVSEDARKTRGPRRGGFLNTAYELSATSNTIQPLRGESAIHVSTRATLIGRDIIFGPLRRPWVYSNFSVATFISYSKVSLTAITAEQQTADLSKTMAYDENLTSSVAQGDTLSQILDMYGD